ncbi:Glycogen [hydrothermal vent metagenome]|uniref:Glycogen n=1 Tax=hydrothermal vent metagenome TaxID=652676 RepID=A0A3B1DAY5_9ZZZZ
MSVLPAEVSHAPEVDVDRAPPGVLLAEVGWEVCNPVGGIYQVLRSKAPSMVHRWQNRYLMVGPYAGQKSDLELDARRPTGWLAEVVEGLREEGITAHTGRWLVQGRPRALLLEHSFTGATLDEIKYQIWKDHGIESPGHDELVDEVVGFAEALRRLFCHLCQVWEGRGQQRRRVLAHFHEWMSGLAIPMIRREQLNCSVVFTTHATITGRYIASSEGDFYSRLPTIDHEAEAKRFGIAAQHHYERAAAHGAHVFTTISPITAEECAVLLGRKPDLILPNGLNIQQYNVGHEFQTLHAQYKEKIHEFVMGHFFPSYSFELEKTTYMFTSGRYEPRNKGFDLCLEACARLNEQLRREESDQTVVLFIVTRREHRHLKPEVLQSRGVLAELHGVCRSITQDMGEELFRKAAAGERVVLDDLLNEYWRLRLRRTQAALRINRLPPVVTHTLADEDDDEVLRTIRRLGLINSPEDRVKIVYHPDFISTTNPLWGIEYEQFVRGCHLGLFPSAYEPWGYTPLECVALGVPAVTSDLAGFGRYVAENFPDHDKWGMHIIPRRGRSNEESAATLADRMWEFCQLNRRGRIAVRNEVERRSWNFEWSKLGRPYHVAHDLAVARAKAGFY